MTWYNGYMTNTNEALHNANALAFIVDSINDDHFLTDIEELDYDTMMEFAEMYNFTEESLKRMIGEFRKAAFREVTGTR